MVKTSHRATIARFVIVVIALSMTACSTPDPMQRMAFKTAHRATMRTDCARIERDLTVAWAQRHYWCRPEHLALRTAVESTAAPESLTRNPNSAVDIGCEATNQATVDRAIPPPVKMKEKTSPVTTPETIHETILDQSRQAVELMAVNKAEASEIPTCTAELDCESGPAPIENESSVEDHRYIIPFAHTIQVLGPQGRAKVDALLSEVKQARHIELRGATLEDGSEAWKNQFAVGRALAVRKRLTEAGVDRHRIKILYRDPDEVARWVRVTVYE